MHLIGAPPRPYSAENLNQQYTCGCIIPLDLYIPRKIDSVSTWVLDSSILLLYIPLKTTPAAVLLVYVIGRFPVVFGINSTSSAVLEGSKIARGIAECYFPSNGQDCTVSL